MLTPAGNVLTTFTPESDPGLGIRNVAWHPNGMFLAVGGWDDRVCFASPYNVDSALMIYSIDLYTGKPELVSCSNP